MQSNLPVPKQNEVYYWEAKIFEKPENVLISIGMATKPYPLFRLPGKTLTHPASQNRSNCGVIGWHKHSVAYTSTGARRFNQPFTPTPSYGHPYVQGDVIGVGYRPRTGTVFFTRNGKKLEDIAHGLKTQNLFPTIGATGPCSVHVNFGQMGFVFIEANVKKWGLAPMTGSLAPPPPYGSEQGSILLEGGQPGVREGQGYVGYGAQGRQAVRSGRQTMSPGPLRSPTDISLAQFSLRSPIEDAGEGPSATQQHHHHPHGTSHAFGDYVTGAPPEYESPDDEDPSRRSSLSARPLLSPRAEAPPIPSYDVAVGIEGDDRGMGRNGTR